MNVNQILENSPIGFGISEISADDATLLYVNSRYAEIFHTTPEALLGSNARDLYVNPEARQELLNQMQEDGSIRDGEVKFRRADGTEFWALVSFFNTEYEGRPARMGWIYDISEVKSAQQETAERERELRDMLEASPVCVAVSGEDGHFRYLNSRAMELTGASEAQLRATKVTDNYADPNERKAVLKTLQEGGRVQDAEVRMKRADGTEFWALLSIAPVTYRGENTYVSWVIDITRRRKALQALAQSEERFRRILESSPIGVGIAALGPNPDKDGAVLRYVNPRHAELFGGTEEQLIGTHARDLFVDADQRAALLGQVDETGAIRDVEVRMRRLDGSEFWGLVSFFPIDYEGQPARMAWIYDISDRKAAEAQIAEREMQLRTIMEHVPAGITLTDGDFNFVLTNGALGELYGLPEELLEQGRPMAEAVRWLTEQGGADAAEVDQIVADRMALHRARESGTLERHLPNDRIMSYAYAPTADGGVVGVAIDVTDRRRAEERLRAFLESAPDAMVIVDPEGTITNVNVQTERLFGYAANELVGHSVDVLVPERVRAGHAAHRQRYLSDAAPRPMGAGLELAGQMKDGREFPIEISLSPIETPDGMLVSAAVRDITERKLAEQELQKRSKLIELLRQTAEAANKAVSFEAALGECLTRICESIGWPVGHAYLRSPDGAEKLVPSGIWHLSDEGRFKVFREVTERTTFELGVGLPGRVMATGRPEWIDDVMTHPNFPRAKAAQGLGVHSAFAVPVTDGTELLAVLEFFTAEVLKPDDTTQQTFQTIIQIGDQLGRVRRRVEAEAELRHSKEQAEAALADLRTAQIALDRFMDAIDHVDDGVVFWDADERFVLCNERYRELSGGAAELLEPGTSFEDYLCRSVELGEVDQAKGQEEQWLADRLAHHRKLGGDKARVGEFVRNGRWLRVSEQRAPDGGTLILVTDIHDLKEREEETRRAKEEAESALAELRTAQENLVQSEKMATLGQLTAGIAHEIKNPLNFINNFSETSVELIDELKETLEPVLDDVADDDARDEVADLIDTLRGDMSTIAGHGRRADSIMKTMLMHARGQADDHQPTDLNALIEEALNLAYHGERARHKGFNISIERDLDPSIGDVELVPHEISRVLVNLIGNGFYATAKRAASGEGNGYEPTIAVSSRAVADEVEIQVRDNGTGIPPEVRDKLFQPFFTTKPTGEGTGLGLSLSYDIVVQNHRGAIDVDSEVGDHTTFTIRLPKRAAEFAA